MSARGSRGVEDRRSLRSLFRHSFPLGVDQGITSLAVNAPRYAVQGHLGTAALGVYSTLGYLAQVVTMIASSLGVVVVPRLAQHKRDGRRAAFVRILLLSTVVSMAVAVVAMLAAAVAGDWAIGLVLGRDYVDRELLLVLLLGASAVTLQRCLGRALTGAHRFVDLPGHRRAHPRGHRGCGGRARAGVRRGRCRVGDRDRQRRGCGRVRASRVVGRQDADATCAWRPVCTALRRRPERADPEQAQRGEHELGAAVEERGADALVHQVLGEGQRQRHVEDCEGRR